MQKSNIMTDEGSCHSLTARSFAVDGVPGTIPGGIALLRRRSVWHSSSVQIIELFQVQNSSRPFLASNERSLRPRSFTALQG